MKSTELVANSLVLYKGQPGRVTESGPKKITVQLQNKGQVKVRPKDVILLHPGPVLSLRELKERRGEVETAWELLAGGSTSLAELAELAYGEFTPASAWSAWLLVADGLYFAGTPDNVVARSPEEAEQERNARQARAAEAEAWNSFLARLADGRYQTEDESYLRDVEALALGREQRSRVLQALGQAESQESAHALLLNLGYWDASVNPYVERAGLPAEPASFDLPALPQKERRDLTHLISLAIDDEGSRDPDDALSLEDGRLWVHIADAAALVTAGSDADMEAQARGANLYLPEGTVPMLPVAATHQLALGLGEITPAISFGMEITPTGEIGNLEIVASQVKVTRLTYEEAERQLDQEPLRSIQELCRAYHKRRLLNEAVEIELPEVKVSVDEGIVSVRPLPLLQSRDLVREAMLMTGEAVARLAQEQGLALPFTSQEPLNEHPGQLRRMSQMVALRRSMKPGHKSTRPLPHAGLGLPFYVQSTSPLRRYLDLVVHQQLHAYLEGREPLDLREIGQRIGATDAVTGSVRWAERRSVEHWTLVYLMQNPDWSGRAVVVDRRGKLAVVLIPALALETTLYPRRSLGLDTELRLAVRNVNLPALEAHFEPLA